MRSEISTKICNFMTTRAPGHSRKPGGISPTRPRRWLRGALITAVLCLPAAWWLYHGWFPPPLRVSPETTVITSPLLPDGRPDYVTYLNQKYSEGVTPENNAAVILAQIAAASQIVPPVRIDFSPQAESADNGSRHGWIEWETFARENGIPQSRIEEVYRSLRQPEKIDLPSSPDVASFLAANQPVFELLLRASQREKFFLPLTNLPELNSSLELTLLRFRTPIQFLAARGHVAFNEGNIDDALRDFLTVLRLGRLLQTRPEFISLVIGGAYESEAIGGLSRLLSSHALTPEQGGVLRGEVASLPTPVSVSQMISDWERLSSLDMAISLRTTKPAIAHFPGDFRQLRLAWGADLNVVLIRINRDYDEFAAIAAQPDFSERLKRSLAWKAEVEKLDGPRRNIPDWTKALYKKLNWMPPLVVTEEENREVFAPDAEIITFRDRLIVRRQLLNVALKVSEHSERTGEFPASLEVLTSLEQQELTDPWSKARFHYSVHSGGFTLWSVGPDQQDDGGWELYDDQDNTQDDVRFGLKPSSLPPVQTPSGQP